jgi:hypothetical protein
MAIMRKRRHTGILGLMLFAVTAPLFAQTDLPAGDDEPVIWPTVRYDWPMKLSGGILIQPPFKGRLAPLLGTFTVGKGGYKGGIGVGAMGGNLAAGHAVQLTVMRTFAHPHGADPRQTYVGVEGSFMIANIGVRAGPAVRVGAGQASRDRVRMNLSVGWGF